MSSRARRARSLTVAAITLGVAASLVGCGALHDTFKEKCDAIEGSEISSTTKTDWVTVPISGTVTGTIIGSDGKVSTGTGTGTGVYSGPITITMRLCVVDGKIKDMELQ